MGSENSGPVGYAKGDDVSQAIGCGNEEEITCLFANSAKEVK